MLFPKKYVCPVDHVNGAILCDQWHQSGTAGVAMTTEVDARLSLCLPTSPRVKPNPAKQEQGWGTVYLAKGSGGYSGSTMINTHADVRCV